MVTPLRVAVFGTPAFAVPTLEAVLASRHEVCGVLTQPDRPSGRGQRLHPPPLKVAAATRGLPVVQPERLRDPSVGDTLRAWRAEVGVVAAYGKLIPPALIGVPRLGMINVHASLLPRYRGASPVHRAVINGDAETGVTIMRVVEALDAGPTFAARARPIGPDETSEEVEADLARLGAGLLVEVLDALSAGEATETPQDEARATYAPRLTRADGLIDWTRAAADLHNLVRGLHPWPHAWSLLDGARLVLHRSAVDGATGAEPPGTVVEAAGDAFLVATGEGGRLRLLTVQAEGRRPMSAREFLAGHRVTPGTTFTAP